MLDTSLLSSIAKQMMSADEVEAEGNRHHHQLESPHKPGGGSMTFDISLVLETVLGSALGAGATFVGIWLLFFKARVEHLQAISAPNLAKELQSVSQMLDQSAKEKQELGQQLLDNLRRVLPELLKGPVSAAWELASSTGRVQGGQEAVMGLQKTIQSYLAAVETGAESPNFFAFSEAVMRQLHVSSRLISQNISAAELKQQNLVSELGMLGKG